MYVFYGEPHWLSKEVDKDQDGHFFQAKVENTNFLGVAGSKFVILFHHLHFGGARPRKALIDFTMPGINDGDSAVIANYSHYCVFICHDWDKKKYFYIH